MSNLFKRTNVIKAHHVPKFILKHFTYDGNKLYSYDLLKKNYFTPTVSNVCTRNYFYDFENEPYSLENFYCELERNIAPIIQKLNNIDKNPMDLLDDSDIPWLIIYRISQVVRNPAFMKTSANMQQQIAEIELSWYLNSENAKQSAQSFGINSEEFEKLKNSTQIHLNHKDFTLEMMVEVIKDAGQNPRKYLDELQFFLAYNPNKTFIINDNGVGLLDTSFFLPLTPQLLLYTKPKTDKTSNDIVTVIIDNVEQINIINNIATSSTNRFIYGNNKTLLETSLNNDELNSLLSV